MNTSAHCVQDSGPKLTDKRFASLDAQPRDNHWGREGMLRKAQSALWRRVACDQGRAQRCDAHQCAPPAPHCPVSLGSGENGDATKPSSFLLALHSSLPSLATPSICSDTDILASRLRRPNYWRLFENVRNAGACSIFACGAFDGLGTRAGQPGRHLKTSRKVS